MWLLCPFLRDTYTIADELVNVVYVAIYYNYVEPFLKDDSDDLTQKGSKFQSEHVLGTKECMYALV